MVLLLPALSGAAPIPHKGSSPRTLDLFEDTLTIPTPGSEPLVASAKPQSLAGWSDDQLAQHLGQILDELQRRMEEGRGNGRNWRRRCDGPACP